MIIEKFIEKIFVRNSKKSPRRYLNISLYIVGGPFMKNTEIKAHRVGSKAYQKELFRLFYEFDRLTKKLAKEKDEESFSMMLEIASSIYSSPLQEIIV